MTSEIPNFQEPEERDVTTPEGFTAEMFDQVKTMLEFSKGAVVVAEIPPQFIKRWGDDVTRSIDLQRGLILRIPGFDFGLSLGDRGHVTFEPTRPNFEFGFLSQRGQSFEDTLNSQNPHHKNKPTDEKVLKYLDFLLHHERSGISGFANFYTESRTIRVDYSSDKPTYKGRVIDLPAKAEILSDEGLDASLKIISDLIQRTAS